MIKKLLLCSLTLTVITAKSQITGVTIPNPIPEYNGTYEDYGQHHFFYQNTGEIRYNNEGRSSAIEEAKYYTKNAYPNRYLLQNNNISFLFFKRYISGSTPTDSLHRIDFEMDNSNASAVLARVDTQNTCVLNYFNAITGSSGITDKRGGASIAVQNIWTNIDMVYTSNNTGLKIFYIIWPGGNLSDLQLHVNGSKSNAIVGNNLVVDANWSSITFVKPKMYQYTLVGNIVTPVNVCNASWQSLGGDMYTINNSSSSYSSSLPLIVQISEGPAMTASTGSLKWSTYFGGGDWDRIYKTKSDANNNLYVAGSTISPDLPQNPGATNVYQSYNLGYDGFLSQFNSNGALQWTTFVGGSSTEVIKDFEFKANDVYCIGYTQSSDLPVVAKASPAFNDATQNGGWADGLIFQVTNNGQTCNWLTYFGGDGDDELNACKFDGSGNFFAVGISSSTNMTPSGPTGSYQHNYNTVQTTIPPAPDIHDGIIMKFNATTSAPDWFTFYGTDTLGLNANNNLDDILWGLDISGTDIYACGMAGGTNLPGKTNSKSLSGYSDGIIVHFTTAGALSAAKFTDGNIENRSVKINNSKVYTCGMAKNGTANTNSGSYFYDNTCVSGDLDACFSVNPLNLTTTIHQTFFGGSGSDEAYELQFGPNDVFYITGDTYASNFPITSIANTFDSIQAGGDDYFLVAFKENNTTLVWGTCLGSSYDETDQLGECASISIDGQNYLHLGGCSNSYNNFPLANGLGTPYFQPTRSGGPIGPTTDGTITRFDLVPVSTYVGLNDFKGTSFSFGLYPNPTTKYLTVDNEELLNQNLKYAIYNLAGQKLAEGTLSANEQKKNIDVSLHPQGVYIINVSNGTKTFSNKFIKAND